MEYRQKPDQYPIIGHDQPKIPVEHAVDDFRNAALLLAENQQDDRIQEERGAGRQQHGAFLADATLEHGPEQEPLHQCADDDQGDRRGKECHHERQLHLTVDRVGNEPTQHIKLAMSEVQDVHQREDQRQSQRDQSILGAQIESVGDDLFHRKIFPDRVGLRASNLSPPSQSGKVAVNRPRQ
jgi:hypothetical protein